MTGEMRIRVSENGVGIDVDLNEVDTLATFELMHSVSVALGFGRSEMLMYCQLEQIGVFEDAADVTHCKTDKELEHMLYGASKEPEDKQADDELREMLRAILRKLEG